MATHVRTLRPRAWPAIERVATFVGLAVAVAGLAPRASSAETPAFGPKDYIRGAAPATFVVERFPACRPEVGAKLRVENGPSGRPRAAMAVLALNQREVMLLVDGPLQSPVRERAVTLQADNTLLVWWLGPAGAALRVSLTQETGCLDLQVASPVGGSTVPAGLVTVRGTIRGAPEVGVAVNGHPAAVHGNAFVTLAPVDPTITEIVVTATTSDGQTAEARVPLTVTPAEEAVLAFQATPTGGPAPLTVSFRLSSLTPVMRVQLDLDGDGVPDFDGPSLDGQTFVYAGPGIYLPTVTVTDDVGVTSTATAAVQVVDPVALDALLRGKWTSLSAAIGRGDVGAAAAHFTASSREAYREQLADLAAAGALPQIAADIGSLNLMRILDGAVEYDLRAIRDGVEYSFHVVFVMDADGVWRLWAF